jgi:hypothetical protein
MRKVFRAIADIFMAVYSIFLAFTMNEADIAAMGYFFSQTEDDEPEANYEEEEWD